MSDNRFIDLETKLAYQEDAQQQLSDVVARQQQQIETLEAALRALIDRVNTLNVQEGANKQSLADEVPPHY
ncbi:MAG: SlyX family protein [Pseudomonadota bacterium]